MSTCNRLDLESLGSWPTMPKNFPGTSVDTTKLLWLTPLGRFSVVDKVWSITHVFLVGRARITGDISKGASYPIHSNVKGSVKEHHFFGTFSHYYNFDGGLRVVSPSKLRSHFTKTLHYHMSMAPTKKWAIILFIVTIMIVRKCACKVTFFDPNTTDRTCENA